METALTKAAPTDPLLNNKEVADMLGVKSVVTVWRRVKDGTLPKPMEIGGTRRWPKSEILAFIEQAKNARTQIAA